MKQVTALTTNTEDSEKRIEALNSLKTTLTVAKSQTCPKELSQMKQVSQLKLQEVMY